MYLMVTILDSTVSPGLTENQLKSINRQRNKYQWKRHIWMLMITWHSPSNN